ncbi:T9SS type B sorting domain-containing protein [Arenibacter sp. GZD96]|uniref:T9SS type B sorting domain-containing protein n=1 Tax=Aurantibrevibacter litoralis TaxID=3106030 RepID=UPI002AFF689D|nr:T9SS type B sorting domain-containing protein [Arenibacter sp. GZD-96]MEA1787108.1 T9SS type B sorting domain-containing protein [Arenibacter sp. GZD-96]
MGFQMLKKLLCIFSIFLGLWSSAQQCPVLTNPLNGATNIPVTTTISWTPVLGVPGYLISLGTTPGGTDIIDNRSVGSSTTFTPPLGLPDDTLIYVTLTIFFFNSPNVVCASQSFRTVDVTTPPPCTNLRTPLANATDVNGATNIVWNQAPTATGYRLSIGTTPGSGNILNNADVGNVLTYDPPSDFPPNTPIFVQITPYNENGNAVNCAEESFITGALAALPTCTSLISPANGALNVPLTPLIEWNAVPGATSYRVSIGTAPFLEDILGNAIFFTNSTFVLDFEPNRTFFITIVPRNTAGEAIGCTQESFSTELGCGPYFDPLSGQLVDLRPVLNFPDSLSFCENEGPLQVRSPDTADGFRWFRLNPNSSETLLSTTANVTISEPGRYRYEAFTTVVTTNGSIECPASKEFTVRSSEIATITNIAVNEQVTGLRFVVQTSGIGDYEFALDDRNGPYQDSNIFTGIPAGTHTVFVRDKNGCGIAEETVVQDISVEGFPKFFTPNGDGANDFWQFRLPPGSTEVTLRIIHIFNRFGMLLKELDPASQGWDGTFNGRPLPASDYWFRAIALDNTIFKGHFSLKR